LTFSVIFVTPGQAKKPEKFVAEEWIIGVESMEDESIDDAMTSVIKQKGGKFLGKISNL
jgi:hypothetical protein